MGDLRHSVLMPRQMEAAVQIRGQSDEYDDRRAAEISTSKETTAEEETLTAA